MDYYQKVLFEKYIHVHSIYLGRVSHIKQIILLTPQTPKTYHAEAIFLTQSNIVNMANTKNVYAPKSINTNRAPGRHFGGLVVLDMSTPF